MKEIVLSNTSECRVTLKIFEDNSSKLEKVVWNNVEKSWICTEEFTLSILETARLRNKIHQGA